LIFEISTIKAEKFFGLQSLILMDLEFTCWEDSLRTGWAQPDRPPEILELGLVAYDLQNDKVLDTYQSYVKPVLNPKLSSYCKNLLKLSQAVIDRSLPLVHTAKQINDWLRRLDIPAAPTCSWGEDRTFLDQDLCRCNSLNPFAKRSHINLDAFTCSILETEFPDRDQFRKMLGLCDTQFSDRDRIRKMLGLEDTVKRHSALDDALDLVGFCTALKSKNFEASVDHG